jgi:hypothetical protein
MIRDQVDVLRSKPYMRAVRPLRTPTTRPVPSGGFLCPFPARQPARDRPGGRLMILVALVVGFATGVCVGAPAGVWVVGDGFSKGRWTRQQLERLLRTWRGPNGERW